MSEVTKAELEAVVVGNMMHMEAVANASKPEPDVLERLEKLRTRMMCERLEWPGPYGLAPRGEIEDRVADAIAEIERLGKLVDGLHCTNVMLRAITEAEPARWEFRERGSKGAWTTAKCAHPPALAAEFYEVRALAVIAPKGETEE